MDPFIVILHCFSAQTVLSVFPCIRVKSTTWNWLTLFFHFLSQGFKALCQTVKLSSVNVFPTAMTQSSFLFSFLFFYKSLFMFGELRRPTAAMLKAKHFLIFTQHDFQLLKGLRHPLFCQQGFGDKITHLHCTLFSWLINYKMPMLFCFIWNMVLHVVSAAAHVHPKPMSAMVVPVNAIYSDVSQIKSGLLFKKQYKVKLRLFKIYIVN